MKIIELEAENIKKVKAIVIKANGDNVVIGGENEQGKSSALDCILFALGGKDVICEEPLRRGADKGFTKVNLGEIIVERRVTKGGTTLVVTNPAGDKKASPQTILDALLGKLTFDPLAFSRQKPPEQRKTLAELVGIDFAPLTAEYDRVFEERRVNNREVDRLKALVQGRAETPGLPEQEVTTAEVIARLDKAQAHNRTIDVANQAFTIAENEEESAKGEVRRCQEQVNRIRQQLATAEEHLKQATVQASDASAYSAKKQKDRDSIAAVDVTPIKDELSALGERNTQIRANADLRQKHATLKEVELRSRAHTSALDAILQQKQRLVEEAKFPLPGLAINDDAVLFEGLPLQQASSARQIKISAAIGMALNPKLRVMIIREGSLLDDKSLAALQDLANSNDFQLWIERVGKGKEISVVIEDGQVAENRL